MIIMRNSDRNKIARFRQIGKASKWQEQFHKAKKPGWRVSDTGNKYYENRANRSDVSSKKKV